jgi:dolichyl-phosphate-mannose-protein mannosyltransferase
MNLSRVPARGAALAVLFLFPLALRLWPIEHGLPRSYVPDTHAVRAALGMARDRDLVPPVGKYSTYPNLMPYLLLPVYGAQYAVGRATGRWSSSEDFGERIAEHPEEVALPARVLVAVFGALTAWAVFRGARAAGLGRGAWVAAYLVATGLLHLQFSVQERPWILVVFFGTLSLWGAARYARDGAPRCLCAAAAAAGLSFASHQVGLAFLIACGFAWWLAPGGWREGRWRARVLQGALAVFLCLAVGVLIGHPYYLRYGAVESAAVAGGEQSAEHLTIGGQALRVGFSTTSLAHLSRALVGYEPVLVLLALGGIVPALRRQALRWLALFTLAYAAFFMTSPSDHVRYLLPLSVLLAWPAGLFAERLLRSRAGTAVLALLLVVPLVQALRLGYLLRQEDTRAEGERLLEGLAQTEAPRYRVAIDHYGPTVELSRDALRDVEGLRGELRTRERQRLDRLVAGDMPGGTLGVNALPVEEVFGVDERTGGYGVKADLRRLAPDPRSMLSALAATHFLLVNRRPADPEAPFLAQESRAWVPLTFVDPSRTDRPAREAFLPTEMDFPLTALWEVARPGPWLGLYRIAP